MKPHFFRRSLFLSSAVLLGAVVTAIFSGGGHSGKVLAAQANTGGPREEIAALQQEVARLKSIATDQSHAMADAGYHFANLWFAGRKKNWPLAKFYLDETRSHLNWAVRVIPKRKDPAGNEVDLKAILQALDNSILTDLGKAVQGKDSEKFTASYKQMLEGCYACHKASGKPYLRPQIPETPPQPILNFDPDANWPE